ncbi:MAG: EamA family transporter, partial [Flavobacterium sp.]|nr:EamA family transporter [Flavobacterium sp.]
MSKRNLALLGATIVSIIYGITFTIAKDVMPQYIDAYGFILMRVGGSVVLFWLSWLFVPKEKIDLADVPRIIASAFFGVAFNMLTLFKGLSLTSPISAAVIMVTTPMIV